MHCDIQVHSQPSAWHLACVPHCSPPGAWDSQSILTEIVLNFNNICGLPTGEHQTLAKHKENPIK